MASAWTGVRRPLDPQETVATREPHMGRKALILLDPIPAKARSRARGRLQAPSSRRIPRRATSVAYE